MSFLYQHVIRLNDKVGSSLNDNFSTSNWQLKGISTKASASGATNSGNVDDFGRLYVTLAASNTQVAGRIYKALTLGSAASMVATFTATNQSSAIAAIVATNSSGLTGEVTVKYNAPNTVANPIKLQCVYSIDSDISLFEQATQFQSWTPQRGLAQLHNLAAFRINEYISHRFRANFLGQAHGGYAHTTMESFPIWTEFFISPTEPDISKIHNPAQLKIASIYYVLHLAYSKDFIGNTPNFDPNRSQSELYLQKYYDEISSVNIDFDLDKDGDIDDISSSGGIPWSRS